MMNIESVDLRRQYELLEEEIISEIRRTLSQMKLSAGENVFRLEEEFADYSGTRFAIGVGSGTDALHIALLASGKGGRR